MQRTALVGRAAQHGEGHEGHERQAAPPHRGHRPLALVLRRRARAPPVTHPAAVGEGEHGQQRRDRPLNTRAATC